MRLIKVLIILVLIPLLTFNLCGVSFAATPTTYNQPEQLSTPEEDIPVEKVVVKSKTWVWVLVVAAAAGGAAASKSGGGGGGNGGSGGSSGGTINVGW